MILNPDNNNRIINIVVKYFLLKILPLILIFQYIMPPSAVAHVNSELLRKPDYESGWQNSFDLNFGLSSGNTEYLRFKTGYRFDLYLDKFYSFFMGSLDYKEGNKSLITHKGYGHFRVVYKSGHFINPEVFLQKEFNRFILLKDRELAGMGGRLHLIDISPDSLDKSSLDLFLGIGAMYEKESFSAPDVHTTRLIRSTNYLTLIWNMDNRSSLVMVNYFQFDIHNSNDFRDIGYLKFLFSLSTIVKFNVTINNRFDNSPPPGIKKNDLELTNGITVEF